MEITIGMRVRLPDVDGKTEQIGEYEVVCKQPHPEHVYKYGTITALESVEFGGSLIDGIPVITLDDGTKLRGYECWWEPAPQQPTN